MSTLDDVQDAMVNIIASVVYPNGTSAPSIAGGIVSSIMVDEVGSNYTHATGVFTGGGGTGAQAQVTLDNGRISTITVTNPGSGYTTPPTITIIGDGTGALAIASIASRNVFIYAGDPLKQNLDTDLENGDINIAVFAQKGMTRNTTRIRDLFADAVIQEATLFLDVLGNTVTVNGNVTSGQVCVVILNGIGYAYMAQGGDTLESIAQSLSALIPESSINGNIIIIPNVITLDARLSVPGTMRRVLQSEEGIFRVRIIVPTALQAIRNLLGSAIQLAFLTLEPRYYLQMPDGVSASIRARGIDENNMYELDLALVRDYLYLIEYHTVDVQAFQTIADPYQNTTISNLPVS